MILVENIPESSTLMECPVNFPWNVLCKVYSWRDNPSEAAKDGLDGLGTGSCINFAYGWRAINFLPLRGQNWIREQFVNLAAPRLKVWLVAGEGLKLD